MFSTRNLDIVERIGLPLGLFNLSTTVLCRCDSVVFLECILEMGLAGKAQVAADFTKRLICIAKQGYGFPQAALSYICTDADAKLLLEFFEQIRPAFSGKNNYICCADRLIHMGGDELHTGV